MLCLNIRTTNISLSIKTTPGKADPNMPEPTSRGEFTPVQNNLKVTPAVVRIDSTPSREALGLYTMTAFNAKNAARGKQGVSEGIARRMSEGRNVRENGARSNALQNISRNNMMPKQKRVTVRTMPAPKITVEPSRIEGSIDPGSSKIVITPGQYKLDYTPSSIDISVARDASVRMWTTEGRYDKYA